ncbi:hypothetical protein L3Y34_019394 [Caenorhabditis briggsae]|uniref:Uncharacterized protein n=1 Tax=Caenorhabditis briggsae TaxID=6238 RepID=A0AAE9DP08_CAEBR|nr:hypothetical protein L3Y34_019394 [Caenorhabditis briggsae]
MIIVVNVEGLLDFCLWNEIQQIFIGWRSSGIMEIFKANHQNGMLRFSKRMEWPQGILTMKWSPNQEVIALSTKTGMIFGELNDWKWETFAHKFLDEQTKFMQWINNEKVGIGLKKGGVIMMNKNGEVLQSPQFSAISICRLLDSRQMDPLWRLEETFRKLFSSPARERSWENWLTIRIRAA